jgi:hypothetical protein
LPSRGAARDLVGQLRLCGRITRTSRSARHLRVQPPPRRSDCRVVVPMGPPDPNRAAP